MAVVVVIAAWERVVLLLDSVMLLSVLYTVLVFVLWSSVLANVCQLSVFCSYIFLSISVLSVCIWLVMFWGMGVGVVCLSLSRCLMRSSISGVKFGLCVLLLPLGMYFLSAFCIIVLKVCTAVFMSVICVLFSVLKCCSVSSVKISQLALL